LTFPVVCISEKLGVDRVDRDSSTSLKALINEKTNNDSENENDGGERKNDLEGKGKEEDRMKKRNRKRKRTHKHRGLRREEVNMKEKKKGKCMIISKPMTVSVCKGEVRCKADFLKGVFSKEQMKELEVKIRNNDHLFEKAEDTTRRNYSLFIGHWASRNYHKPGNPVYPAGKGGGVIFWLKNQFFITC
jgi:hypothetical protein